MIFVTVGTQLPFPRLISMMDDIAGETGLEVFAQTADPTSACTHIQNSPFLPPDQYDDIMSRTTTLVGHAGIGTILTAKKAGKPVIIVPRKASLGEHRNEHQLATAGYLKGHEGVYVAQDREELRGLLQQPDLRPASFAETPEKARLLEFLSSYIYSPEEGGPV